MAGAMAHTAHAVATLHRPFQRLWRPQRAVLVRSSARNGEPQQAACLWRQRRRRCGPRFVAATAGAAAGSAAAAASDDASPSANGTSSPAAAASSPWQPQPSPLNTRFIWGLVATQRRHLALAGVSLILCVAMNLMSPVVSGGLFEVLVKGRPFGEYKRLLAVMVGLYILEPLLSQLYIRSACAAGEEVQAALRMETFHTLLAQRMQFYDTHSSAELTTLLSKELDSIRNFVFSNVSRDRGPRALLEACGSVLVLFWLSWRLGPILAGVICCTACIAYLYRQQTKRLEAAHAKAHASMAQVADATLANIRTVRIFAGEGLQSASFGEQVAAAYRSGRGFAAAKALLEGLNRSAIHASLLALYALGGWLVSQGLMPVQILLSAIGFTFSLVFATQGLLQSWADLRTMLASVRRVQEALSKLPPDPSMQAALPKPSGISWADATAKGAAAVVASSSSSSGAEGALTAVHAAGRGDLELRGVSFSYPARPLYPVLRDLTLRLPRGKVTALVGRSGAGKSTVAALLERLYPVDGGGVYLAGTDIQEFSREAWVHAVTAVSQEPVLWSGSIADNILYGRPGASQEQVVAAAEAANAHQFIMALPDGYDTVVGERGGLLSGGQRQRIALARALLKDSPIIILDEATSALDNESERQVQAAIDKLVEGRTVLVIAHRLSTVQAAHQIAVLDGGRLVEVGSHMELSKAGGLYSALVSAQTLTLAASV